MAKIIDKMLNFVGWEAEGEVEEKESSIEGFQQSHAAQSNIGRNQNKVVNMHQQNQMKVVVIQPDKYDDAQIICDHLKGKKPVIINLEELDKETAQRIVDFLSGSVYALEGNIQKISSGIFLIAPYNVDIMGDFKDEIRNKNGFPWMK